MDHLRYHPQKHLTPAERKESDKTNPYEIWLKQVKEIMNFCREGDESALFEYLWLNWYSPQRWILWARAIALTMPICNSNGPVESHFSMLKRWHLNGTGRPSPAILCALITEEFLTDRAARISLYRLGRIQSPSLRGIIQAWRDASATNEEDFKKHGRGPVAILAFRTRDREEYKTDPNAWYCGCKAFQISPYHICKHLVRSLCKDAVRLTHSTVFRQRTSPVLFIEGVHDTSQQSSRPRFSILDFDTETGRTEVAARCLQNLAECRDDEIESRDQFRKAKDTSDSALDWIHPYTIVPPDEIEQIWEPGTPLTDKEECRLFAETLEDLQKCVRQLYESEDFRSAPPFTLDHGAEWKKWLQREKNGL
jgi:hypothetical protein